MLALLLLAGVAAAARLDNTYLPPSNARTAGGNGHFLAAPSSQYGAPNGASNGAHNGASNGASNGATIARFNGPSAEYGVPSVSSAPAPVYGAPSQGRHNGGASARANILRFNNENNGDGSYRFEYETENKISQQEVGEPKHVAPEGDVTVVQGTYSYVGDDGHTYTVNYVADENGFQPVGDHIHKEIQMAAAEAARSAASEGGYPGSSNGQNGYRY